MAENGPTPTCICGQNPMIPSGSHIGGCPEYDRIAATELPELPDALIGHYPEERNFHVGGATFSRRADGSVYIRVRDTGEGPLDPDVMIDASSWASTVAAMSSEGDNAETYRAALNLHGEGQG